MSESIPTPTIYAVSDARGATCERVVASALAQFPDANYRLVRQHEVSTVEQIRAVVTRAAESQDSLIFYTLVQAEMRQGLRDAAREQNVPVVDVIGPAFTALHDLFHRTPASIPGLLYKSHPEHFDMMEAIEYTLSHDDGSKPHEMDRAHVVLVGVSRAGKSSTAYYLAYHGVKVANIPLVPGIRPPAQLLEMDPRRVVGIRVNRSRLRSIRASRAATMGVVPGGYLDEREINLELRYVNGLIEKHGWHIVDASYQAVEEVAKQVIKICGLHASLPKL